MRYKHRYSGLRIPEWTTFEMFVKEDSVRMVHLDGQYRMVYAVNGSGIIPRRITWWPVPFHLNQIESELVKALRISAEAQRYLEEVTKGIDSSIHQKAATTE